VITAAGQPRHAHHDAAGGRGWPCWSARSPLRWPWRPAAAAVGPMGWPASATRPPPAPAAAATTSRRRWRSPGACVSTASTCPIPTPTSNGGSSTRPLGGTPRGRRAGSSCPPATARKTPGQAPAERQHDDGWPAGRRPKGPGPERPPASRPRRRPAGTSCPLKRSSRRSEPASAHPAGGRRGRPGGRPAATPQATRAEAVDALGVRVKVAGEQMVGQDVELVATNQPEEDRPVYERPLERVDRGGPPARQASGRGCALSAVPRPSARR
jgi:hypothetical protein